MDSRFNNLLGILFAALAAGLCVAIDFVFGEEKDS